ncbi:MFS transporter [Segnochrobactrum spirostomi]|nr:MFS transporter [Segnochrobactrum spirostomi]
MLLASLGTSIANIALPALAAAFAAPFAAVQPVVVAYLGALTIAVLVAGRLGDARGLKPMLVAGLAVFGLASLACALAPSLSLLVAARALQGIGAAFMMTLAMALMRQMADPAQVGRAMGLLGTVSALGTALGPALGGLLIPLAGWRGVFAVLVPLAALAFGLAVTTLPAGSSAAKAGAARPRGTLDRALAANLAVNLMVAAVMMTTLVVGPFYLALGLALTATQVGLVMTAGPIVSIVTGVPAGRLVDRWGSVSVLRLGLALLGVGAGLLAVLPEALGVTGYLAAILVLTPGYQLFQAANNTAALGTVAAERRGTVSGLLTLSRNLGLIAGASAMGAVFAVGVGTADFARASPAAIAHGLRLTFLVSVGLMVISGGLVAGSRAARPTRL